MSKTHINSGADAPTEAQIAAYLQQHPDFFSRHTELLSSLCLNHESGAAVSLIEKQVAVLREQKRSLNRQIEQLLVVAEDNHRISGKIHHIVMHLMEAGGLDKVMEVLTVKLAAEFNLDGVGVRIHSRYLPDVEKNPDSRWAAYAIRADQPVLAELQLIGQPLCGRLKAPLLSLFFKDAAYRVQSVVVLPFHYGWLAMGSADSERFYAAMDTLFLQYLGEAVAKRLHHFFREP